LKNEDVAVHVGAAKSTLEHTVAKGKAFAPMVMVIRDGRIVAQVLPSEGAGAVIAKTARVAGAAFGADELVLVSDTYLAIGADPLNPLTGQQWRSGEMQDLAENHDGIARGLVSEGLLIFICGPSQPDHLVSLCYTRHDDGTVTWDDELDVVHGRDGAQELPQGRFTGLFDGITKEMRVPDPFAALVLGKQLDAMVALSVYDDETDPMMVQLKADIDSGKLRTR